MPEYKPTYLKVITKDKKALLPDLLDILVDYRTRVPVRERGELKEILSTKKYLVLRFDPHPAYADYSSREKALDVVIKILQDKGCLVKQFNLEDMINTIVTIPR